MVDKKGPTDVRRRRPRAAVTASCVMLVLALAGCSSGSRSGAPNYLTPPVGSCPAVHDDATPTASIASGYVEPTPAIPADDCGRPIAAVDQAIEATQWEIVETSD